MDKNADQNEVITDVNQSIWGYLWHNDRPKLIIYVVLMLIPTIYLAQYGLGIFIIVPSAIFTVWYSRVSLKMQAEFMKQFAAANGFAYCPDESPTHLAGWPFSIGNNRTVTDLVKGSIENLSFEYFAYSYSIGRTTTALGVLAVELGHHLPDTFVQNISETNLFPQAVVDKLDSALDVPILSLGTEFDKYYRVRITPGAEMETLQIFEPDLMANLIDQTVHFDFELSERALYIYTDGHITKKADLDALLAFARTFAARFERETSNLNYAQ